MIHEIQNMEAEEPILVIILLMTLPAELQLWAHTAMLIGLFFDDPVYNSRLMEEWWFEKVPG